MKVTASKRPSNMTDLNCCWLTTDSGAGWSGSFLENFIWNEPLKKSPVLKGHFFLVLS
jgi:hypothetical protein